MLPGQTYEYGLGLDYESQLFQTMTHSHGDIEFLYYNDPETLAHAREQYRIPAPQPLLLPPEIQRAAPPIPPLPPAQIERPGNLTKTPYVDNLLSNLTWYDVPLATNMHVPSTPALLHFNGDKSYLSTWWPQMWYQPDSRALLRRYMSNPLSGHTAHRDTRGGRGGVWTDTAQWYDWEEVCRGYEDEVFADGKGPWGHEEGVKKIYNSFGKLIVGSAQTEEADTSQ